MEATSANTHGIDIEVAKKFWLDNASSDVTEWRMSISSLSIGFERKRVDGDITHFVSTLRKTLGTNYTCRDIRKSTELEWHFGSGRSAVLYYDPELVRLELYDFSPSRI